ncbi:DUF4064 domain-containing protein [Filibacter tadaridae]|uniref:DUF4064 domain-containing protein n=1 Tax=Filibacter tadaridae TaxID=2483811 RepID=A0A3P5WE90_9BACL|nr:DUF4064 domain-containing protein [Filibacter tadaridae]VDC19998.1 hypothetical protein FILTAD_00426 [Filibacter tadaridae]
MNRTAEKVLSIISAVFTVIGVILSFITMAFLNYIKSDPAVRSEIEAELLTDPAFKPGDMEIVFGIFDALGGFMWLIIIALIISLILTIVGIVSIWNNKNPKLAGTMFIIGGLLAGILSLTSILLYIAGILCFTKKPPLQDKTIYTDDQQEGTMRPL